MSAARAFKWGKLLGTLLLALVPPLGASGQGQPVVVEASGPIAPSSSPTYSIPGGDVQAAQIKAAEAAAAAQAKPGEGTAKPGNPGQPSGKPGDDKDKKEAIQPVHRPPASAASPNRDEFKIRPDAAGKVRLCFNNQPWQPVLEWLATISGMSLDWQELPGDSLNLTTRRSYSVPEVRDLINQHLLRAVTRCSVTTAKCCPWPRLKSSIPASCRAWSRPIWRSAGPHEFVKVSFPLEMFSPETAMNELKPMLSPNGKLSALPETSRLEAMDAVLNLRDVDALLRQQQARASQPKTFREFKLRYARAEDVHKLLTPLLANESSGMPGMPGQPGMNPQQAAMMAQAQAQGGQPGQPQPNPMAAAAKEAISIAVNQRNNSILVQAKPDKMAIIAQMIEAMDIPPDRNSLSPLNMGRMQVYRLTGVDPEPVIKTLKDVGNLDPTTRLEFDRKNNAIIAYAPLADHVTIRAGGQADRHRAQVRGHPPPPARRRLRGGHDQRHDGQRPQEGTAAPPLVLRLRLLPGGENQDGRVSRGSRRGAQPLAAPGEPRRAYRGREPAGQAGRASRRRQRIDHARDRKRRRQGDERASQTDSNRLAFDRAQRLAGAAPGAADSKENKSDSAAPAKQSKAAKATPKADTPSHRFAAQGRWSVVRYTDTRGEPVEQSLPDRTSGVRFTSQNAQPAPPPVKIAIGPDGKLIISSADAQALDLLEQLAADMPADHKDYRIFHLKFALAFSVAMNLEDFFKEKKEDRRDMPWWYMEEYGSSDNSDDDRRLSKRPKLKFISDTDTNTVLVEGANPRQLKTIEELIQLYDQPPPSDSQSVRKTELIKLKYSKAKVVADTIKDVYRDLLSANDKALAENKQEAPRNVYNFGSDTDSSGQKTPHFKGLLSIGVDETSNSLMISAPAYLFDHIARMVHELDQAAVPEYEVKVVPLGSSLSPDSVKAILDEVYNQKKPEKEPEKPAAEKPGTGKPGNGSHNGHNHQQHQEEKQG